MDIIQGVVTEAEAAIPPGTTGILEIPIRGTKPPDQLLLIYLLTIRCFHHPVSKVRTDTLKNTKSVILRLVKSGLLGQASWKPKLNLKNTHKVIFTGLTSFPC